MSLGLLAAASAADTENHKKIFELGNKIDYMSDKNIYLFMQRLFGIHPSSVLISAFA